MTQRSIDTLYAKPGYLIRRLQQMAVSIFLEEAAEFDITPVQYGALAALAAFPGTDQGRLALTIGTDRTTVSGVIDRLEAKALVERRASPTDRRTNLVYLTAAGAALLEQMEEATRRVEERILAPLPAAQRRSFVAALSSLVWHHNDQSRVPIETAAARKRG
jgi:DNA-binding MarR family transcriptional regulator